MKVHTLCQAARMCYVCVQCGADVNRLNSYEQTALEVVNKFTASRGARDIKQMLRGESCNFFIFECQHIDAYMTMATLVQCKHATASALLTSLVTG